MLATARAQVAAYPTVNSVDGEARHAVTEPDRCSVTLATGETLDGARLVLAFGVSDELACHPGTRRALGHVGAPLAVLPRLRAQPTAIERAVRLADVDSPGDADRRVGPTTFYLNGSAELDAASLEQLEQRGDGVMVGITVHRSLVF
jgi:hypothetical protein